MSEESTPNSNSKLRSVMLIDDNEDDNFIHSRQILRSGLVSDKDSIFIMKNGEEALEFFLNAEANSEKYGDTFPPELVFLDINMPRMNGFEFLEKFEPLHKSKHFDSIVILMLTSSNNKLDLEKAEQFETLSGYHTKPITRDDLIKIAKSYFE